MKFSKRIGAILIVICFTVSIGASTVLIPAANAHSPPWKIPTQSFVVASPSPIGVGQAARVNFWLGEPPPTASAQYGDRWENMKVNVMKPDGTNDTLGPFTSDATGGWYTTYTPESVGNYTFQMFFPGQVLTNNNPAPGSPPAAQVGDTFLPSMSLPYTLTVQQTPVSYPGENALPTSYWTRPIYGENNNWYSIGGNWLGLSPVFAATTGMYNNSNYNPYTTAPTTSHILWTKPEAFGGIMGGEFGSSEQSNYYSTAQYEPKFAPIIIQGILYYTEFPGSSTNPTGWAAVNLKTGQTIWTKNTTTEVLKCGQILDFTSPNQYGGLAYVWGIPWTPGGVFGAYFANSQYDMFDAMTGNYILSIVNATSMLTTEDDHGNLVGYYVNYSNPSAPTINMWNSTLDIMNYVLMGPTTSINNAWTWRPPQDAQIPFSLGIQWSKPLATTIDGNPLFDPAAGLTGLSYLIGTGSQGGVSSGVILLEEVSPGGSSQFNSGWMVEAGYSATDGSQLWITNRTETPYTLVNQAASSMIGDGAFVEFTQSELSLSAYSLYTGKLLWGPTQLPNASPYDSLGGNSVIANGTIYLWAYGGDVYAYDLAHGTLKWQYHTPSGGFESPYGSEPLWVFANGAVAGGIFFVSEGHEYSPPLFHGAQQLALNITDGSVVWSIDAFNVDGGRAIADGVMVALNSYDNQIYGYGVGPSKTTVTAPGVGVTTSTPITISGTVMDMSAGSQQEAVAANFPSGLPCVSDGSMSQFMESVYMQQPMPTNITGVPVTLYVLDSNHNYRPIGTTTTDANGFYSFNWKPDIAGNYTVTATFAGSQAYYGSSAQTAFYANPPSATIAPSATPQTGLASNTTLMYGIVAIIIVIIIGVAAILIVLTRKHP